ncbi:hypothetical protein M011DRAFT_494320 [Sporormia fimetaria CBS 119925]|uniref:Polynucleotide 5'-hydroxyl-kinase GRC3 n=1 Tax=Sporormia fimetaria CBS 119925 TaxID=1340428 RepID=A0A6A6VAC8_9PLEO|nr:hypothetical protein M011DRAFT_494320 [Sporormia fimetaria CBS 119925]
MAGKRKRIGASSEAPSASGEGNVKPMSAVAAARLKYSRPAAEPEVPLNTTATQPQNLPSSDVEEEEEEPRTLVPQPNVQLCTWRYGKDYVSSESDHQVTVTLKKNATITLIGCFDFLVLRGAVNLNGANFGARKGPLVAHRAFVPSTHAISVIRGLDNQNEIQFVDCEEPTPLAGLSPLFKGIWNASSKPGRPRSFSLITESDADPLKRPLIPEVIPEDWVRQVEDCASTNTTTLIVGPPSSGKSNFVRRLLNRYLTGLGKTAKPVPSVCFLDLDPAKPAYTPPGQISLLRIHNVDLGPPFSHPCPSPGAPDSDTIIRAHPLAVHGTLNYRDHFLACANDLVRTYLRIRQHNSSVPLIINTPGWLYTHFSTLSVLLPLTKPQKLVHLTDLTSIDEASSAKLDALDTLSRKSNATISHISSIPAPPTPPSHSDAELRAMHTQSYFHVPLPSSSSSPALPLSHTPPLEFTYAPTPTHSQSLLGFLSFLDPVSPSHLLTLLTGSVIHILHTTDPTLLSQSPPLPRTPKYKIPYFPASTSSPNPTHSHIVCAALIRGWDPARKVVQVVVPPGWEDTVLGLEAERTVFVVGACEIPEWAYVEDAYFAAGKQSGAQKLGPWVQRKEVVDGMGWLGVPRRVRRFQQ